MTKQENEMDYEVSASDLVEIKCQECNIAFRTKEELEEHNMKEHNKPVREREGTKKRMPRENESEQVTA